MQREGSIPYSDVSLVDPTTNQPTRVTRKTMRDGNKVRVSTKTGAVIPRPEILKLRKRPLNPIITESCTVEEDVWKVTYVVKEHLKVV